MRATWFSALLPLAFATSVSAQADLQITSTAEPSTGLVAGQEFLVTTTLRNNGPNAATSVTGSLYLGQQESFWFQLVGSDTPGCVIEPIEIDPPTFLLGWSYPSLAAGQSQTCIARLRVQFVPPDRTTLLRAHVDSQPTDPTSGNDDAIVALFFQSIRSSSHAIPASSPGWLLLLAACVLALALAAWHRGRA